MSRPAIADSISTSSSLRWPSILNSELVQIVTSSKDCERWCLTPSLRGTSYQRLLKMTEVLHEKLHCVKYLGRWGLISFSENSWLVRNKIAFGDAALEKSPRLSRTFPSGTLSQVSQTLPFRFDTLLGFHPPLSTSGVCRMYGTSRRVLGLLTFLTQLLRILWSWPQRHFRSVVVTECEGLRGR